MRFILTIIIPNYKSKPASYRYRIRNPRFRAIYNVLYRFTVFYGNLEIHYTSTLGTDKQQPF